MAYPSWFKATTGFRFFDPDGDEVIVLGVGGYRDTELVGSVRISLPGQEEISESIGHTVFHPKTSLVAAYHYKGEWHLFNLQSQDDTYWSECSEMF